MNETALAIFIACIVIILAVFVVLVIFLLHENRKLTLKNKIMGIQTPAQVPQVKKKSSSRSSEGRSARAKKEEKVHE